MLARTVKKNGSSLQYVSYKLIEKFNEPAIVLVLPLTAVVVVLLEPRPQTQSQKTNVQPVRENAFKRHKDVSKNLPLPYYE